MWRIFFFFMGVPMMIMSLFEAIDVLPLVQNFDVTLDGQAVELSVEQEQQLKRQVENLFSNCRTMPAFAVVTPEMFEEQTKDGIYVSLKFDQEYKLNDLPFDELVFEVKKDCYGFNLLRGNKGVFNGRCVYLAIDDGTMDDLYDFLAGVTSKQNSVESSVQESTQEERAEENAESEKEVLPQHTEE